MNNYIFPFLWMRGESEEIMREEISKIYECGIRAVCVEARPHDDFCGPGWWHDMDIIIDEAKKRDMKIWILDDKHFPTGYAAGLIETKYPERNKWYMADTVADVFGSQHELTLRVDRMLRPTIGYWQIGAPADYAKRAQNQLYRVIATKFTENKTFEEGAIDLTDKVDGNLCTFTLPEGQWRVHVLYKTQTDGGNANYINMLDKVSASTQIEGVYESHYKQYGDEFGKTIAGFFSDEPEIGNTLDLDYKQKVGKKGVPLPWSDELEAMLMERWGENYTTYLPYLYCVSDTMQICPQVRYDFMDCVSLLYEANFSKPIGDWCKAHGVEYIGHVVEDSGTHSRLGHGPAHYFRAMTGQDMAGIDIIGSQVVFGAPLQTRNSMGFLEQDGEFFHYILGKMGASDGHLDPKKKGRTMCELFGAYGWGFGVRNMRYLLDHALSRGVNHLVPHAFSMAEYPDIDCPPHFYARGNNGQFTWFAELMKYANRMCDQLNGGSHVASVAVLYDGEADWSGESMPMQKIGRELITHQIEFDVVPLDILNDLSRWDGQMRDGKMIINGVKFETLLIPYMQYAPEKLIRFIEKAQGMPISFVGGYPERILPDDGKKCTVSADWKKKANVISLDQVAPVIRKMGIEKISIAPAFEGITIYHYQKDRQMLMIVNEDPDKAYHGKVTVPGIEPSVYYDGFTDTYEDAAAEIHMGISEILLDLEPGESCLLMEKKNLVTTGVHISKEKAIAQSKEAIDLSEGWKVSRVIAKEYPAYGEAEEMKELIPVSSIAPNFSGLMKYEKTFTLDEVPEEAYLKAEHVYEVMRVSVNGTNCGFCLTPPYQIDIAKGLKSGENELMIEVANTPDRDQGNYPSAPFDFKHDALEPSGMYGKVTLYCK